MKIFNELPPARSAGGPKVGLVASDPSGILQSIRGVYRCVSRASIVHESVSRFTFDINALFFLSTRRSINYERCAPASLIPVDWATRRDTERSLPTFADRRRKPLTKPFSGISIRKFTISNERPLRSLRGRRFLERGTVHTACPRVGSASSIMPQGARRSAEN